jgi:hypothetical protein
MLQQAETMRGAAFGPSPLGPSPIEALAAAAQWQPRLRRTVLTHLADALNVPDGGFSLRLGSGEEARSGFAVSIYPKHEQRFDGQVSKSDIARFLAHRARHVRRADIVLGGWRCPHTHLAFLDFSIVVPSREQALALARVHGQRAIWDFAACESITVRRPADSSQLGGQR